MTVIKILVALAAGAVILAGAVVLYVIVGLALSAKDENEEDRRDD